MLAAAMPAGLARAQLAPVYVDDSIVAQEALARAVELVGAGNVAEAARVLQSILDSEPDRVVLVESDDQDPHLFESVRSRVNRVLLASPELLAQYRMVEGPRAESLLAAGRLDDAERTRLLTRPGLEAAFRLAQIQLEGGRFEAARLTLAQLEHHPDRRASHDAARLARAVARYLTRADVSAWAERWALESGLAEPPTAPAAPPPRPIRIATDPLSIVEHLPGNADPRPLVSTLLGPLPEGRSALPDPTIERGGVPRDDPWTFPTVYGDMVFVTDGAWVTAFDRYTLATLWRTRAPGLPEASRAERMMPRQRAGRFLDDAATVAAGGGVIVASAGMTGAGNRTGDPRVTGYDAATGRVLWSFDVISLDQQLESSAVRGPIVISGDVAVIPIRKRAQAKRVSSAFLAGVGLHDGQLRWLRLLATAGSMPSAPQERSIGAPVVEGGIVYHSDEVGVGCAIEAATGRPIWVRRFRGEPAWRGGGVTLSPAWSLRAPVFHGETVYLAEPGGTELLQLALADGTIRARRSLDHFGDPRYFVRVGDYLAAIGISRITFVPFARFADGMVTGPPSFSAPAMRGRAMATEDHLVVPVDDGLVIVNPAAPTPTRTIILRGGGNSLILDGQVLIADDSRLNNYLAFEIAEATLERRLSRDPRDASPALILADLAARAGRAELVAPAADRAMAIFDADVGSQRSRAGRKRLFTSLLAMVSGTLEPSSARREDADAYPTIPLPVVAQLVERLGACVDSSEQRVEHLLIVGRLEESRAAPARAVEAYQAVLLDDALAALPWPGAERDASAAAEATRRLRELLERSGSLAYVAFDDEAARELAALGSSPSTLALERFATRYPCAMVTPEALSMAATLHAASGRHTEATRALALAYDAAKAGAAASRAEHAELLPAIACDLLDSLLAGDRPGAALRIGESARSLGATPEVHSRLLASLESARRALLTPVRRPRIGPSPLLNVQLLDGWELMLPEDRSPAATSDTPLEHVMLRSFDQSTIALFTRSAPGDRLVQVWARRVDSPSDFQLVRLTRDSAMLFSSSPLGGSFELVDIITGRTRWRTPDFHAWFDDFGPRRRDDGAMATPLEIVRPHNLLHLADRDTFVVAQRAGRIAALSMADGRRLWAEPGRLSVIYDIALGGRYIAVGGSTLRSGPSPTPRGSPTIEQPGILIYETATGRIVHELSADPAWPERTLSGRTRWVRALAGEKFAFGLDDGIMVLDAATGEVAWAVSHLGDTVDAWPFGDGVIALDRQRLFRHVRPIGGGRTTESVLNSSNRVDQQGPLRLEITGSHAAVLSVHGVVVFDLEGRRVGLDPFELGREQFVLPAAVDGGVLALQAILSHFGPGEDDGETNQGVRLSRLVLPSGKVLRSDTVTMLASPSEIAAIDGAVLITAAGMTVVVEFPLERQPAR